MHESTTEQRILGAAADLWHGGGFEAVTTRAVAARAGVNEVTLFRHFSSKEGLLKAMVARAVAGVRPEVDNDLLGPTEDIEQDLRRWARGYLDQTLPVGDLILLGLVEARGRPDLAAACLEAPVQLRKALTERLETRFADGAAAGAPYGAIAEAFYATLFVHVLTAHLRRLDPDEVAARTAQVFARAIGGGTSPAPTAQDPTSEPTAGGALGAH